MQQNKFTKRKTLEFLAQLDDELERCGYQRKFKLYCMGGTKMVLSGLRHSSDDVDFLLERKDFRALGGLRADMEWKKGIRFDAFSEGELPGYTYTEFEEHAKKAPYRFRHLDLYFIDDIDFLLTKALAGRIKDIRDIKVLLSKKHIPKEKILERFEKIKFQPEKEKELREKFEEFLKEFYK